MGKRFDPPPPPLLGNAQIYTFFLAGASLIYSAEHSPGLLDFCHYHKAWVECRIFPSGKIMSAFDSKPVCVCSSFDFNQQRGHSRLPAFHCGFEQWWARLSFAQSAPFKCCECPPWLAIQIIVGFEYICSPLQIQSLAAGCSVVGSI